MRKLYSLFLILIPLFTYAQSWEVGAIGGAAGYMGDFTDTKPYELSGASGGLQVKKNFNGYWGAKLSLMRGRVEGEDAVSTNEWQQVRNLSFFSDLNEVSLQSELNFLNFLPGMDRGRKWSPFLFAGVGAVFFNPKTIYQGEEVELAPLMTEGTEYKKRAVVVPYGAGLKLNVRNFWNIGFEAGYRTVFTDYLDDLSQRYPDLATLASPRATALSDRSGERTGNYISSPGLQRGDFRKRDNYMFVGISLSYTFVSSKCYAF